MHFKKCGEKLLELHGDGEFGMHKKKLKTMLHMASRPTVMLLMDIVLLKSHFSW
jgi:thiamine pyrophosphate-dependent acetolactate synthase large subunit-like protein